MTIKDNAIEWRGCDTWAARIWIAGDIVVARQVCRQYCMDVGLCVTVTPTDYIYTGGEEAGVVVGIINYPRFPDTPENIKEKAEKLGMLLMDGLCQGSFSLEYPNKTFFLSRRGDLGRIK